MTEPGDAPADYARSLTLLLPFADYVTVNVSSPNTPGLRDLQAIGPLAEILDAIGQVAAGNAVDDPRPAPPVLVKLAPDLAPEDIDAVVDLAIARDVAGIIVTNTTLSREGLASALELSERPGGLSGAPLRARSTEIVGRVARRASGRLVVIGVGGIFTADDAWEKLAAGASLVQVYTGFVYGGPGTARAICRGLLDRMDREGIDRIGEIVGSAGR